MSVADDWRARGDNPLRPVRREPGPNEAGFHPEQGCRGAATTGDTGKVLTDPDQLGTDMAACQFFLPFLVRVDAH